MVDELKIEKGIPPPSNWAKSRRIDWDTILKMEPGDSVFFDNETFIRINNAIRQGLRHKGLEWKIAFRTEGKGVRLWRKS